MAKAKKLKPTKLGRVDYFKTTAGNTFTSYINSKGQKLYKKNGRFTSARSYRAAFAVKDTKTYRPVGTWNLNPDKDPLRTQRDMAYTEDGIWKAGPDASTYHPGLKEGDLLSKEQITFLRHARMMERNFWQFAYLEENEGLSYDEILEKYADFVETMRRLREEEDFEGLQEYLESIGWTS